MEENRKKHPLIAAVLSFIFPGAGQLYNEDYGKALFLIVAGIAAIVSIVYSALSIGGAFINGAFLPPTFLIMRIVTSALVLFGLWLYGIIDGAITAQRITKSNLSVNGNNTIASKFQSKESLIAVGVVLIIAGFIGILNLLGIHFLSLIKYSWPIALILLGGYLLAKSTGFLKGEK